MKESKNISNNISVITRTKIFIQYFSTKTQKQVKIKNNQNSIFFLNLVAFAVNKMSSSIVSVNLFLHRLILFRLLLGFDLTEESSKTSEAGERTAGILTLLTRVSRTEEPVNSKIALVWINSSLINGNLILLRRSI